MNRAHPGQAAYFLGDGFLARRFSHLQSKEDNRNKANFKVLLQELKDGMGQKASFKSPQHIIKINSLLLGLVSIYGHFPLLFSRYHVFYEVKVCVNPMLGKSVGVIFLTVFACFMCVSHTGNPQSISNFH